MAITSTHRNTGQHYSSLRQNILPAWFGTGILLLVAGSLLLAVTYRLFGYIDGDSASQERGVLVAERQLLFLDNANGDVSIIDAQQNRTIERLTIGEDGFMRSVMRGFARQRKASGIGQETPFRLTVWQNGLVSLIDPATGRIAELSAFGPDNVAAFTRLLK